MFSKFFCSGERPLSSTLPGVGDPLSATRQHSLSLTPVVYMLKVGIHDINNNICVFSLYHKDYVVCISLDIDSVVSKVLK
ncbi:hypothetical protein J6590_042795 [Homalodisca vitripennis]|nr:hypothetical protein J6590_042795 [Homalodisca vitripennis]